MKKTLLSGLCIAFVGLLPASAEPVSDLVDNTLSVTFPNGAEADYMFASDGTFSATNGASGVWERNGDTFCFTPTGEEEPHCGPFDFSKRLGDSWTADAWDGSGTVGYTLSAKS